MVSWEEIQHHLQPGSQLEETDTKPDITALEEPEDSGNSMNEYAHVPDAYLDAVQNLVQVSFSSLIYAALLSEFLILFLNFMASICTPGK